MISMILFGSIFVIAGIASMIGMISAGLAEGDFFLVPFGILFGGAFIAAGYFALIRPELKRIIGRRRAIQSGRRLHGVIVEYRDDNSVRINGVPILVIIVSCVVDGREQSFTINTGTTEETAYPLGAECDIYLSDNKVYVDPKSVVGTAQSMERYQAYLNKNVIPAVPEAAAPGAYVAMKQRFVQLLNTPGMTPESAFDAVMAENSGATYFDAPFSSYDTSAEQRGTTYLNGKPI